MSILRVANLQFNASGTKRIDYDAVADDGIIKISAEAVRFPVGSNGTRPPSEPGLIRYNSDVGYMEFGGPTQWIQVASNSVYDVANASYAATNVAYNASNAAFDQSNTAAIIANTALPNVSNAVFAGNLRVTGVLSIGSNTITITDNHIIASDYYRMNTAGHMVAITDGNKVNAIYSVANAAFDSSNNVGPQIAPAFNKANNALANTSGTFDGNLTITGNLTVSSITTTPANGAYSIEYIVVGGGGAGGYRYGGGGAGGYISSVQGEMSGGGQPARPVMWVTSGTSFTVTIGAGAPGNSNASVGHGANGTNTVFGTVVAFGGGGGSCGGTSSISDPLLKGWSGGCGGGASGDGWGPDHVPGGSGTYAQGFAGGDGWTQSGSNNGGGGGGAGGPGVTVSNPNDAVGNGGIGVQTNINGTPTFYAGGGAGTCQTGNRAAPGRGGGAYYRQNGSTNTGGGGGSGLDSSSGGGGSGIVIIRYANATQRGAGGNSIASTSINGVTYWVHTFTSSGTFVA